MTAIVLPGQPGSVNDIDITQQGFRDQIAAIAIAARRVAGAASQGISTTCLYVDPEIGIDAWRSGIADPSTTPPLANQQITAGYSKSYPFKTLQRALIEAARLSIVTGPANDITDRVVIRVSPGEHIIDNATPGLLTVESWGSSKDPTSDDLRAFNTGSMGVILPRGVSIIGEDLRKTVIRPSTVPAANLNPSTGRGAIFKATGNSFFFNFTFKDALTLNASHHLLSAFEFCSDSDLSEYYGKICTAFDINPANAEIINPGETQITTVYPDGLATSATDSTKNSSPYIFNCSLRSDYGMCGMFLDGSKVTGFRSMVVAQFTNVSLQKDMNAWEIYSGGTWSVPSDYDQYISANINDVRYRIGGQLNNATGCYQTDYRSFGFKCINNAILQEVSCFVIGDAVHHWTASGGECTITNSNSNFGMTALLSSGFRGIGTAAGAFPQDTGFACKSVRRPLLVKTDGSNIRQFSIGTVSSYDSGTGVITLNAAFDPKASLSNGKYSLKEGDYIWIENKSRDTGPGYVPGDPESSTAIDARARLAANAFSESSPNEINVVVSADPAVNNIDTVDPLVLVGNRVYIRRLVDTRTPEQRQYSIIVANSSPENSRRPVGNFVVRLSGKSTVANQLDPGNGANQVFLITDSGLDPAVGADPADYRITIRPADSSSNFAAGTYYRAGTPIARNGRVLRAKRTKIINTFSSEEWEQSLVMLPSQRGVESPRIAIGPEIVFDKDISGDPNSTNLGIDQLTDSDVVAQIKSTTDFIALSGLMQAIGYSPSDVGSASSGSLSGVVLAPQATEAARDWDPTALSSPAPSGKLTGRVAWPLEFNRPSIIRAFGQAYEWAGQGNYTKAMPKYQVSALSDQHKIDYFAVSHMGGRVYNTGFNEDGLIVQGGTITDLSTNSSVNTEVAGLGALQGDPDFPSFPNSFDSLTISNELVSLNATTVNNLTINGTIDGNPVFSPGALPVATDAVQGIIELATAAEALLFGDINKAVTPAVLGYVRGRASGIASLDSGGTIPLSEIPVLTSGKLPQASDSATGIVELATDAETAALVDDAKAVTPAGLGSIQGSANGLASLDGSGVVPLGQLPSIPVSKLPAASETQQGVIELATNAEVAALSDASRAVTPASLGSIRGVANGVASLDSSGLVPAAQIPSIGAGNLPSATTTASGIVELATNAEALAFADSARAIVPSSLGSTRGVANGFASLDGSGLLPTTQLPVVPLAKIPTLTNEKIPVLDLAKIPTLPASKLLTTPLAWISGQVNFDNSSNFTFTYTSGNYLAFGTPQTSGYVGTSGFIYVTNGTADAVLGINSGSETNWRGIINTWVDPVTSNSGLTGNLLIGYYIAAENTVIYTASRVG